MSKHVAISPLAPADRDNPNVFDVHLRRSAAHVPCFVPPDDEIAAGSIRRPIRRVPDHS